MALIHVVKYNGSPDVFAWKYPDCNLSTWTQLIVSESQEAVLYKGGKAYDLFTAGTYSLQTENIPLLNRLINMPYGGQTPFTAEIWFVNKAVNLDIKWGTASPIQLHDPKYNIILPVRSYGQFGIAIEDSAKFLMKLVGTLPSFGKDQLTDYFKGFYLTNVKDTIATYIVKEQISVLEIGSYLNEISDYLTKQTTPILGQYGIKLLYFNINDISVPQDDSAVQKVKDALSRKAEMDIIGYHYEQERFYDESNRIDSAYALNKTLHKDITSTKPADRKIKCTQCGELLNNGEKYCWNCGAKQLFEFRKCPQCGNTIGHNMKYCTECGMQLATVCPECNTQITNKAAKYCHNCGCGL
ncbi:MAG: SPFH domain-containing protein [Anaerofustis sp.]